MSEVIIDRFNDLLSDFNKSFDLEPEIKNIDGEDIITNLKIKKINDDGVTFINGLFELVNEILVSLPDKNELAYNKEKGLIIAKEVTKLEY